MTPVGEMAAAVTADVVDVARVGVREVEATADAIFADPRNAAGRHEALLGMLRRRDERGRRDPDWAGVRAYLEAQADWVEVQADMLEGDGAPLSKGGRDRCVALLLCERTEPGELAEIFGVDPSVICRAQKRVMAEVGREYVDGDRTGLVSLVGWYVEKMMRVSEKAEARGDLACAAAAADAVMRTLARAGVLTRGHLADQLETLRTEDPGRFEEVIHRILAVRAQQTGETLEGVMKGVLAAPEGA